MMKEEERRAPPRACLVATIPPGQRNPGSDDELYCEYEEADLEMLWITLLLVIFLVVWGDEWVRHASGASSTQRGTSGRQLGTKCWGLSRR